MTDPAGRLEYRVHPVAAVVVCERRREECLSIRTDEHLRRTLDRRVTATGDTDPDRVVTLGDRRGQFGLDRLRLRRIHGNCDRDQCGHAERCGRYCTRQYSMSRKEPTNRHIFSPISFWKTYDRPPGRHATSFE